MRMPIVLGLSLAVALPAAAQMHEPDPAAMKRFGELVDAYRRRPGLAVHATVSVELAQGEQQSNANEVEADFIFGPGRRGVVHVNGYTCWLDGGRLTAINDANDSVYYSVGDDGSPFYALLSEFQQMPFPHLAIALGEPDLGDLCMQLHQMAPWIVPTSAGEVVEEGRTLGEIRFTSDHDDLRLRYDPDTDLIDSILLTINGGDYVQPGTTLTYRHAFDYEVLDGIEAEMAFDPGDRQRVDLIGALQPMRVAAAGPDDGGGDDGGHGGGGLVGQEAPGFTLATMDGGAVDLADLRGRVVVLDFWATWCGPCRAALPLLHEVAAWAGEQKLPVTVLTINVWERGDAGQRLEKAQDFWTKSGHSLPVAMDYTDVTAKAYGVSGIPTSVIIDPGGVVRNVHPGLMPDYVDAMKREIQAALGAD